MLYFDNGATTFVNKSFFVDKPNESMIYFNPNSVYAMTERSKMSLAEAHIKTYFGIGKDNGVVLWFSSATHAVEWLANSIGIVNQYHRSVTAYMSFDHSSVLDALHNYGSCNPYRINAVWELRNYIQSLSPMHRHSIKNYFLFHQLANQLTGHVFDLSKVKDELISCVPKDNNLYICADATAYIGKCSFNALPFKFADVCDAIWFSGHKFHVPVGIGAIWVSEKLLTELEFGKAVSSSVKNQHGLVKGTPPVSLIMTLRNGLDYYHGLNAVNVIGSYHSFRQAFKDIVHYYEGIDELPETTIIDELPENSLIKNYVCGQLPSTLLVRFKGVKAEQLATWLATQRCYISTANSACEENNDFSVLDGLGIYDYQDEYVRITFDHSTNTIEDVETLVGLISEFYLQFIKEDEDNG